jgi:ABC-2 type transport system permease protein
VAETAVRAPVDVTEDEPTAGGYDLLWRSGLLNVGSIARREVGALFVSPIGWVIVTLFIPLVSVFGFLGPIAAEQQASMDNVFSILQFLMLFAMPAFTMRVLAEERRAGTLEILLTSPVRDWELVAGKWLGVLICYIASIAFTLVYVVLLIALVPDKADLHLFGTTLRIADLDYGTIVTSYVGMLLLGATMSAVGLLASSLTQHQVVAFIATFFVILVIWYVLGFVQALAQPPVSLFLDYASASNRFASFLRGEIVLKDVVYFASLTFGALYIATGVLESRKWR